MIVTTLFYVVKHKNRYGKCLFTQLENIYGNLPLIILPPAKLYLILNVFEKA